MDQHIMKQLVEVRKTIDAITAESGSTPEEFAKKWWFEEDAMSHEIGLPDYRLRITQVLAVEAAKWCARPGHGGAGKALALLREAVRETEAAIKRWEIE